MEYKVEYLYNFKPFFSDVDSYNCVHHSKYFIWFENARINFMREKLHLSEHTILKYRFPVSDLSCKYYKPICFGQEYTMRVLVVLSEDVPVIHFKYRVTGYNNNTLYAKATTTHVLTDKNQNIFEKLPEELMAPIRGELQN